MEDPTLAPVVPTTSVVSSTPLPESTALIEDPRVSKARVEKLKRRIIRAVAGKLSQNPDENEMENMWSMMKKSCKCDCKLLWKHMRAVTLKKLKRLLSADDRVEDITAIARLTITDWLLYDLVLAHEDIDVIGQDIWEKTGEEPEPLIELFFLVDEYRIEELEGTKLIAAWLNLTREYNESGRKCSPMILQRRWYQLKQATRKAFYIFWGKYRGRAEYFEKCDKYKPTALQVDIAKRYKNLILTSFPDWNEMIKMNKVVLAHEFDNYITSLRLGAKKDTDVEPDLQVIEQNIDTIDIEDDSDTEQSNVLATPTQVFDNKMIVDTNDKSEIENIDLTNVDEKDINFFKEMNIPCETPFVNYNETPLVIDCGKVFSESRDSESRDANDSHQNQAIDDGSDTQNSFDDNNILIETNDINVQVSAMMQSNKDNDNNELDALHRRDSDFNVNVGNEDSNPLYGGTSIICDDSSEGDITEITDIFNSSQIKIETPFFTTSDSEDFFQTRDLVENAVEEDIVENDKMKGDQGNVESVYEENIINKLNDTNLPKIESVTSMNSDFSTEITVKNILAQKATELERSRSKSFKNFVLSNDLVIKNFTKSIEDNAVNDIELLGGFEEIPKDLQFVDDGIVLEDENENNVEEKRNELSSEITSPKVDLKLLLFATVYTKKLDDMDVFKFKEFDNVHDKRIIEYAETESKPVDLNAVNLEDISLPKEEEQTIKKEPDSSDQDDNLLNTVYQPKIKEENIITKTEYLFNEDINNYQDAYQPMDSEHHSNQNETSSDEGDEPLVINKSRVNPLNKMFQKPQVKNYNPIQLCKNPDFNTRLKRLTAGFLSYEKNREYLKRCHPVTIDLHKSFELNLIDSTIYLEKDEKNTNKTKESIEAEDSKSLHENISLYTNNDVVNTTSNDIASISTLSERNKVINLPDITEIRRVNQNLLTAEVAPLQIVMNTSSDGKTINQSLFDRKNGEISTATGTVSSLMPDKEIRDDIDTVIVEDTATNKAGCERSEVIDKTTEDSRNNKNANKPKPQQKKPYYQKYAMHTFPWNRPGVFPKEEECLLASDTVDKMLALFSGQEIKIKNKKKGKKKLKKQPMKEPLKKDDKECTEQNLPEYPEINNTNDKSNNDIIPHTNINEDALAVLSISEKRKKREYCCWAQKKIWHPNLKKKHPCKQPLCTCCCKYKLLEKFNKMRAQQPPTNQPPANIPQPPTNQPDQTTAFTVFDKDPPKPPTQKKKFVVNIPKAKNPPSQSNDLVPSIVIDGNTNTNKINVPKFLVRYQTRVGQTKNVIKNLPITSKKATVIPNIDITSNSPVPMSSPVQTTNKSPLLRNRLMVKTNLTNIKNVIELKDSNYRVQRPSPLVSFKRNNKASKVDEINRKSRSRMYFRNISPKMPAASIVKKSTTNTLRLQENEEGKSSASPIFLGENKILLSTVRGPMAQPIPIDPPKIILPQGVQFILLPNNELALSIAPGVELATEQLRHLELVIQALQKVLGTPKVRESSIDCNEKTMDNREDPDKNNHDNSSTNKERILNNEINLSVNEDPEKTLNGTDIQNVDSVVRGTDQELTKRSVNTEKPTTDTYRKTILSDLMEMSGISAEDAKLPEPSILPAKAPNIICDEMDIPEMHSDLLRLFNNPDAVAALTSRPDLSIITAYSDLRYAADNNAKFYKMDVCTGEITRINVFLKKNKQLKKSKAKPVNNQELIDLTSDDDNTTPQNSTVIPTKRAHSNNMLPYKDVDGIKPLKLFRAMHSSILKHKDTDTTLMNTNMRVTSGRSVGNNIIKVVNLAKQKQNLHQGIKTDMNILDVPKESDQGETSIINLNESSSDSDDEPLAKKAKRNHDIDSIINSELTDPDVEDCEMLMDADLDKESVVYEEMETEFEPPEDAGEDCILGV